MKRIIKNFPLVLALSLVFLLMACGNDARGKNGDKSIYEHGLDLISLMKEMAGSEAYFKLYSNDPELQELVSAAGGGDYAKPKAVYQMKISDDTISGMAELASIDELSGPLKEYVSSRMQASLANQINAMGEVNMLAAASICTAGKPL